MAATRRKSTKRSAGKKRSTAKRSPAKKRPAGKATSKRRTKGRSSKKTTGLGRTARKGLRAARGGIDTVRQAGEKTWEALKSTTAQVVGGVKGRLGEGE